jgi:hypothetical protein
MTRLDGSLARKLDFAENPSTGRPVAASAPRSRLRIAPVGNRLRLSGPGKYRVLEVRRRRAQIAARHLLDLMEAQEASR